MMQVSNEVMQPFSKDSVRVTGFKIVRGAPKPRVAWIVGEHSWMHCVYPVHLCILKHQRESMCTDVLLK